MRRPVTRSSGRSRGRRGDHRFACSMTADLLFTPCLPSGTRPTSSASGPHPSRCRSSWSRAATLSPPAASRYAGVRQPIARRRGTTAATPHPSAKIPTDACGRNNPQEDLFQARPHSATSDRYLDAARLRRNSQTRLHNMTVPMPQGLGATSGRRFVHRNRKFGGRPKPTPRLHACSRTIITPNWRAPGGRRMIPTTWNAFIG